MSRIPCSKNKRTVANLATPACLVLGDEKFYNKSKKAVSESDHDMKVFWAEGKSLSEFTLKYLNYPPKICVVQQEIGILDGVGEKLSQKSFNKAKSVYLMQNSPVIGSIRKVKNLKVVKSFEQLSNSLGGGEVSQREEREQKRQEIKEEIYNISPGELILGQGLIEESVYFLIRGEVSLIYNDNDYQSHRVGKLEVGSIFGHTPHLTDTPSGVSFYAATDVIVKKVHFSKAFGAFEKSLKLSEAAMRSMAVEVAGLSNVLNALKAKKT